MEITIKMVKGGYKIYVETMFGVYESPIFKTINEAIAYMQ